MEMAADAGAENIWWEETDSREDTNIHAFEFCVFGSLSSFFCLPNRRLFNMPIIELTMFSAWK